MRSRRIFFVLMLNLLNERMSAKWPGQSLREVPTRERHRVVGRDVGDDARIDDDRYLDDRGLQIRKCAASNVV
jgi:hypothetical protein